MAGSLIRIMNGRSVSLEVKRDVRNTIIVPTLTYASVTWAWNESQRARVLAVGRSYFRSVLECVTWVKGTSVEWWKK